MRVQRGPAAPIPSGRRRAGQGGQLFRRVEVAQHGILAHLHLRDRIQVTAEQEARAGIAGDAEDLGEEAPVPQHRVALLAAEGGQHDQPSLVAVIGVEQAIDDPPGDQRHVAEADDRGGAVLGHRGDARLEARRESLRVVGRVHEAHGLARERLFDLLGLMAGDNQDRPGVARQHVVHDAGDHRLARFVREQQLVMRRHAAGAASGEHHGRDGRARCAGRDRFAAVAGAFSRGIGRASISLSRPPTPIRITSAGPTGNPANSRGSTKSMPFSFGLRAHPGSTSAGRAPIRPTQMRLPGSTGIPKCTISPPARTMPAGPTSRRSTTAEAPDHEQQFRPLRDQ